MDLIEIRHHLHSYPELSGKEFGTQGYIMKTLFGHELSVKKIAGTGVLVEWKRNDGPYVLFRADMDALPMYEKTGVDFTSKNPGIMHACGHDVHMTILFGLIERVLSEKPELNILFLFQPAEEAGGGAARCLEELTGYDIEEAFALHVTDEYPEGTVNSCAGRLFAASCEVYITFSGRAAHMAVRQEGRDTIVGASRFINKVYSLEFPGAVFGFGVIEGGNALNIVADSCRLEGTIRADSHEYAGETLKTMGGTAEDIAREAGLTVEVKTGTRYPEVRVDQKIFHRLRGYLQINEIAMKYTAEDFGYISRKYPSFMFWLGTGRNDRHGLHNPYFLPHDDVIEKGVSIMWSVLNSRPG